MTAIILLFVYFSISIIVGFDYVEEYTSVIDYASSIPIGDLEYYDIKLPSKFSILRLLFFPSYIIVFLSKCR